MNIRQRATVTTTEIERTIIDLRWRSLRTRLVNFSQISTIRLINRSKTHECRLGVSDQRDDWIKIILMREEKIHAKCKW
jgi:hypothetical protein